MKNFKFYFVLVTFATSLTAFGDTLISENDFLLLPPFCKARLSKYNSQERLTWEKRLGPDFIHVHHFCFAENSINKAFRTTQKSEKEASLRSARNDITYVIDHSSSKFILLPKAYYDLGQIQENLGNQKDAMDAYKKSIESNPNIALPYLALSRLYISINLQENAINTLEEGLRHKPNSKILSNHLSKLKTQKK